MAVSQTIATIPTSPSRADPANFVTRHEAVLDRLETLPPEMNTWTDQVNSTQTAINDAEAAAIGAKNTAVSSAANATAAATAIDQALDTVSGETASTVAHAADTDAHPNIQERFAVLINTAIDLAGQSARAVAGGRISLAAGSATAPALSLGSNAGLYQSADGTLSVLINGTEVARFSASGLAVTGGSVGSL